MKKNKRCKAISMKGRRCRNSTSIGDYCITHYPMKFKKDKGEK